jgi:tetrapyrrole methylase family protein/MazG family protein/ATP diphosphatase
VSKSFDLPEPLELPAQRGQTFPKLVELMRRLLGPDGCPWDREQTPQSLRRYVLEEACEVIDAIDSGSPRELQDELGDLALQVVFLSELGRKNGSFGPDDVVRSICEKLVRRHPHVFSDVSADTSKQVEVNWEAIKQAEKKRRLLDGVPRSLSALLRAQHLSERVARVGFDWPDRSGSRAKVEEEIDELDRAIEGGDRGEVEAELGDLLFALVNLARHNGLDAERALRGSCDRFMRRFEHVEARVESVHGGWPRSAEGKPTHGVELAELDAYWEEAKARE